MPSVSSLITSHDKPKPVSQPHPNAVRNCNDKSMCHLYGQRTDSVRTAHGHRTDCARTVYGQCTDNVWKVHSAPVRTNSWSVLCQVVCVLTSSLTILSRDETVVTVALKGHGYHCFREW